MANGDDNLKAWQKAWLGIKTAVDLVGRVNEIDTKLSKQADEILQLKLGQAKIVGQLDVALRFVESPRTTPAGSSS